MAGKHWTPALDGTAVLENMHALRRGAQKDRLYAKRQLDDATAGGEQKGLSHWSFEYIRLCGVIDGIDECIKAVEG